MGSRPASASGGHPASVSGRPATGGCVTRARRRARALEQIAPYARRARAFSGWRFDDLDVRPLEPGPPWDYAALARERAERARAVLDLGTGGGEALASIVARLAAHVVATEEWPVNAPVARDRLAPLGATVVRASSLRLPFRDATFDLILDRHEALDPPEVARVLRPGGCLVTQQVGHDDWAELWPFFPRWRVFPDHYAAYADNFRTAGLAVTARRHHRRVAFGSLGDLAFMLLVSPWSLPDFDPVAEIDTLLDVEEALGTGAGIVVTESRYLLVAEKARGDRDGGTSA
jgi:SAM-dependent methyltransferase